MYGNKFVEKGKNVKNAQKYILYTAPCGKTLRNMAAIGKFLRVGLISFLNLVYSLAIAN